jgi:hypothetical protein
MGVARKARSDVRLIPFDNAGSTRSRFAPLLLVSFLLLFACNNIADESIEGVEGADGRYFPIRGDNFPGLHCPVLQVIAISGERR